MEQSRQTNAGYDYHMPVVCGKWKIPSAVLAFVHFLRLVFMHVCLEGGEGPL